MKGREILSVDPESPDREMIARAAALIKKGGLVIFPTNTFYGLGAAAFDIEAVDRVFRVKERDPQRPLPILIADMADLDPLVRTIPQTATRLIEAFWPGGLTLVFHAADVVPQNLTGHTGKIGVRLAGHPVASAMVKTAGSPVTATSANLSGKPGCTAVAGIDRRIKDRVDLVLDAGTLGGKKGSTVVDVTVEPPEILREGVISSQAVAKIVKM
ncbi:MAG: threonylcarbamoyl-AMP synthase [Desulfobacterales bacterium]|nr:threonylcarbamoyl-AMP synthase [Desulfobacterales bacterium]